MKNSNYINASEIAEFIYCHRAWFLKRNGHAIQNTTALIQGSAVHQQVGQQVTSIHRNQSLARLLVAIGVAIVIVYFVLRFGT